MEKQTSYLVSCEVCALRMSADLCSVDCPNYPQKPDFDEKGNIKTSKKPFSGLKRNRAVFFALVTIGALVGVNYLGFLLEIIVTLHLAKYILLTAAFIVFYGFIWHSFRSYSSKT